MGIFERMQKLTKPESTEPKSDKVAKVGDIIQGVITQVVQTTSKKKGGFGFINSPELPFERIFFHWTGLQQQTLRFPALSRRMRVEFQLQHDEYNGYRAIKIKVLE